MEVNHAAEAPAGVSGTENLRVRGVRISNEVAEVLRRASAAGNFVRLPEGQLDRPLYEAVDKTLRALGGRWSRTAKAHVFERAIEDELTAALSGGVAVDRKKTFEQFFTPPRLAAHMQKLVGLESSMHVLEPSAGAGVLIGEPLRIGCFVTAVELDPLLAKALAALIGGYHGCGVWCADFLEWSPVARAPIDCVLMNPPFAAGADIQHVWRAFGFLRPGGVMAAIVGEHAFFAQDRQSDSFRDWLKIHNADVERLDPGTFNRSGTDVAARLIVVTKP